MLFSHFILEHVTVWLCSFHRNIANERSAKCLPDDWTEQSTDKKDGQVKISMKGSAFLKVELERQTLSSDEFWLFLRYIYFFGLASSPGYSSAWGSLALASAPHNPGKWMENGWMNYCI